MRKSRSLLSFGLYLLLGSAPTLQLYAQVSYTSTSATGSWNTARWNNAADGPTYTNTYTPNNPVQFTSGSYSFSGMGAAINVGNISVAANTDVSFSTNTNTFATGGNVRSIQVGTDGVFNLASQPISTAAGTGFNKYGIGTLVIGAGGNYSGGFTLSEGTMVADGVNSMGNSASNTLTILGGVLTTGTADKNFSGRFGSGIFLYGDFQLGQVAAVNSYAGNGSMTFSNNVSLGSGQRIITLGNAGAHSLLGVVANIGSSGISIAANSNGTGRLDFLNSANTFTGPINIDGTGGTGIAEARFGSDGSFGNPSNSININGGRLGIADASTFELAPTHAINLGNLSGTAINIPGVSVLTYNGSISDLTGASPGSLEKQGTGIFILGGSNTYTGNTHIASGTLRSTLLNVLPVSTSLSLGQSGSASTGVFDMNGNNQEVQQLNSISGPNTLSANNNEITSATAATLTIAHGGNFGNGTDANSGIITGMISIIKSGIGTLILADENTYTGSTQINSGTLQLNRPGGNTISPSSVVSIANGATLKISSSQTINSLTIASGGLLEIDPGATLTVGGNLTIPAGAFLYLNGTLTSSAGLYNLSVAPGATIFMGNSAGLSSATGSWNTKTLDNGVIYHFQSPTLTPFGNDFTEFDAVNITFSADVTLDKILNVHGILTVESNAILTTAGKLKLKSTSSTHAAKVGPVSGSIIGSVLHERFLSAPANGSGGRSWRLLTSPLKGATSNSVFSNWQNNGVNNNNGLEIWGPGGTGISGNGLAAGPAFSMRTYNGATNAYASVTDSKNEILFDANRNKPFLVFASGPYGSGNISSGSGSTLLNATGELITGTQTYTFTPPSSSNNYFLVGNPYACPIDFNKVWLNNTASNNINRKFWVIDPSIGSIGAYATVTYDENSGQYISSVGAQNQFIQTGQAFFVEGNSVGNLSSLIIEENDKEVNAAQTPMFRTNNGNTEIFRVTLSKQLNNSPIVLDGTVAICHQNYDTTIDGKDGSKFSNFNENISQLHGLKKLAIESRPLFDIGDTLRLSMTGLQPSVYNLVFDPSNFNAPYLNASLYDKFLNTLNPISLVVPSNYSFTVSSTTGSFAPDRFSVVFGGSVPLNIEFTYFNAVFSGKQVDVKWSFNDVGSVQSFEVERSKDGKSFQSIASFAGGRNETQYYFADYTADENVNYYRIKATVRGGGKMFSKVVKTNRTAGSAAINLFPNPLDGEILTLSTFDFKSGDYSFALVNVSGSIVVQKNYRVEAGNSTLQLKIGSIASGTYLMKVLNENGETIVNTKLIKH